MGINPLLEKFVNEAISLCKTSSLEDKYKGIWSNRFIVDYNANLPPDEITSYLSNSLGEIFQYTKGLDILIVGGGTGRLGRNIVNNYRDVNVIEIDSSPEMVEKANEIASIQGLGARFSSKFGDAFKIPYDNQSFDYVIAQGFMRFYPEGERLLLEQEFQRVSRQGMTIAECNVGEVIYGLRDKLFPSQKVIESEMEMFRMSLFYMILKKYNESEEFRNLINSNPLESLSNLAGKTKGMLYELRITNSQSK